MVRLNVGSCLILFCTWYWPKVVSVLPLHNLHELGLEDGTLEVSIFVTVVDILQLCTERSVYTPTLSSYSENFLLHCIQHMVS